MTEDRWEYRFELIDTAGQYLVQRGHCPNDSPFGDGSECTPARWRDVNDLGLQGWELVAVFASQDDEATAVFKRCKNARDKQSAR